MVVGTASILEPLGLRPGFAPNSFPSGSEITDEAAYDAWAVKVPPLMPKTFWALIPTVADKQGASSLSPLPFCPSNK